MKKVLAITAAFICCAGAFAEDYSLYFDSTEGSQNNEIAPVANIRKLVFENGKVVAVMKDDTQKTTDIANIKRLFFSTEEAVGIDEVTAKEAAGKIGVYDLAGRKLNASKSALQKGVYIIDGKKTIIK